MTAAQFGANLRPMTNAIHRGKTMTEHDANHQTHRLIKEREAAHILNLKVSTLRRWRWAGRGPRFLKLGGAVRYDPADLSTYIQSRRRASTSDPGLEAAE